MSTFSKYIVNTMIVFIKIKAYFDIFDFSIRSCINEKRVYYFFIKSRYMYVQLRSGKNKDIKLHSYCKRNKNVFCSSCINLLKECISLVERKWVSYIV